MYDEAGAATVNEILEKAKRNNVTIHFPVDFVIADAFDKNATTAIATDQEGIPDEWMGLDIGPKSRENFDQVISRARCILWNG